MQPVKRSIQNVFANLQTEIFPISCGLLFASGFVLGVWWLCIFAVLGYVIVRS
jgi:hypothetical protein